MPEMTPRKHVLFLTWKDIRHPDAGWAEAVMLEYARGLVRRGFRVTWFASSAPGLAKEETIEGVKVVRRFSRNTVWMFAWLWYRGFKKTEKIDFIVDEAGGWPLLSPLYEKRVPVLFFAHHVGDREFDAYPFPVGFLAKAAYEAMFRAYRKTPAVAVSVSTKAELVERFGFDGKNVTVIENATDAVPLGRIDWSSKSDDVLFLWRLTSIKRAEDAVRAFASAVPDIPATAKLSLVWNRQDAAYSNMLENLVEELGLSDRVTFFWRVDKALLSSLVERHRCLLAPSEKEGFWLVVLEANARGLPAVAYDVPGLRDSVKPWINGTLVPDGGYLAMWREIVKSFDDDALRRLSESSLAHVKSLPNWDDRVESLVKTIENTIRPE